MRPLAVLARVLVVVGLASLAGCGSGDGDALLQGGGGAGAAGTGGSGGGGGTGGAGGAGGSGGTAGDASADDSGDGAGGDVDASSVDGSGDADVDATFDDAAFDAAGGDADVDTGAPDALDASDRADAPDALDAGADVSEIDAGTDAGGIDASLDASGAIDAADADALSCVLASDCPGLENACAHRTCVGGVCGASLVAAGTPAGPDVAGDCRKPVCDGVGGIGYTPVPGDLPNDQSDCTADSCNGIEPVFASLARGAHCATKGGKLCDGLGTCVACLAASDCAAPSSPCQSVSCDAGACVVTNAPVDSLLGAQTAGDCLVARCGVGGVVVYASDPSDYVDDRNPCTVDACSGTQTTHTPLSVGTPCQLGAGRFCGAGGTCVECLSKADCPAAANECSNPTCTSGACGVAYAAAGTVLAAQVAGDCKTATCNATGGVTQAATPSDVPPGDTCLAGSCNGSTPVTSPAALGASCSAGGGLVCISGACVDQPVSLVRVGDGLLALTSSATSVFVEKRRIDGSLVSTVALPTAAQGNSLPVTLSGTATTEGQISTSVDGGSLSLAGYAAIPGTLSVAASASTVVPRVVARIEASGYVDSTTSLGSAFNAGNPRATASNDGTSFWVAGSTTGIVWVPLGGAASPNVVLASPNNNRGVGIAGGQLYGSAAFGGGIDSVFSIGAGLPTTAGQTASPLAGLPTTGASPYAFVLLDRDAAVAGVDTLYLADDSSVISGGGLQKWKLSAGGTWSKVASFGDGPGVRSVAAREFGGVVALFATTAETSSRLLLVLDDGSASPVLRTLATVGGNMVFRGVALSPR